jgi:predicted transcriptional regulator with HTH domain
VHDTLKPRDFDAFVEYGFDAPRKEETLGAQVLVISGGDREPENNGEAVQDSAVAKQNDATASKEILQEVTPPQTSFDRTSYVAEIERLFRSSPSVIEKVEKGLDKKLQGCAIWSSLKQKRESLGYEVRAKELVRRLVEHNLSPEKACEVLDTALSECAVGGNEEKTLINIICWYLPVCCDAQKADDVRRQYEKGDVNLIKFPAAHALMADSHMAPVDGRSLAVKRVFLTEEKGETEKGGKNSKVVSIYQIPTPPSAGLEVTHLETMVTAAQEHVVSTFIPDFSGQTVPLDTINKIMKDNVRRETLYYLFELAPHEEANAERNMKSIREKLPWVAALLLSKVPDDVGRDAYLFSKLREFLKRI